MVSIDKKAADQLCAVCDFYTKAGATGFDVEVLFRNLEETKNDQVWANEDARWLQYELHSSLKKVVEIIYDQAVQKIELHDFYSTVRILRPGMRLVPRITEKPDQLISIKYYRNDKSYDIPAPLIMIRIIELITRLPENTLRICGSPSCDTPFVSTHKTKIYCSTTCRNRESTYAMRRRIKERLKDAD